MCIRDRLRGWQFSTYQGDFSNLDKNLNIKNSTDYDLLVFEYDSLQNALRSLFISKDTSEKISFNVSSRFVFYFGNTLSMYRIPKFNTIAEHEFFAEAHSNSRNILFNIYSIRPKTEAIPEEYTLTLKQAFLEKPAEEYSSENVTLVRIE